MYVDSAALPHGPVSGAGSSNDVAEAFMLLRASTLKIIRLQLAIERHDRQVALAAVDDLIALDRRLQDRFSTLPSSGEQLIFRRELESERAALSREKLTLAAGILRRRTDRLEQVDLVEESDVIQNDWLGPSSLQFESDEPRRSRWWLAIVPMIVSALVVAAYFVDPQDAAWLIASAAGAVR